MARQIRAGLKETRTIELRLDWLKSDAERRNSSLLGSNPFAARPFSPLVGARLPR